MCRLISTGNIFKTTKNYALRHFTVSGGHFSEIYVIIEVSPPPGIPQIPFYSYYPLWKQFIIYHYHHKGYKSIIHRVTLIYMVEKYQHFMSSYKCPHHLVNPPFPSPPNPIPLSIKLYHITSISSSPRATNISLKM